MNRLCQFNCMLFFYQAPQVEKESGGEGEEEIEDTQEPLRIIL